MGICRIGGVRALNTPAGAQNQLLSQAVMERAVRSLVGVPPLTQELFSGSGPWLWSLPHPGCSHILGGVPCLSGS